MTITNLYDKITDRPKLEVERTIVYQPEENWFYSHHPSITWFNNQYVAIWSNGRINEDDPGQRVLISRSSDFANWSTPEPLLDSMMGEDEEITLTAAGFHQHEGTLVAYAGAYEIASAYLEGGHRRADVRFGPDAYRHTRLFAVTSIDGKTWSEPTDLGLPIVPNHGPQATASGRLIICGNTLFPYSDDLSGLGGWKMAGIYPAEMAEGIADDPMHFRPVAERAGWASSLCEGSFYQTDDGVLHMLLRSQQPRLWHASSRDDGETWSAPEPTDFTDNVSKFHLGRLPDGRFYNLSTPDPQTRGRRPRLILSLSEDGVCFDRQYILADEIYEQRAEGLHKNGQYGYPHSLIHDGYFCAIFSRRKEAMEVLRVPLAVL